MSDDTPPLYARNDLLSAEGAALGYIASTSNIPVGTTRDVLVGLINADQSASNIFTPSELTNPVTFSPDCYHPKVESGSFMMIG